MKTSPRGRCGPSRSAGAGDPERIRIAAASASLFPVLGVRPLIGSLFDRTDELSKDGAVIVLSESLWRQRFGADPAVLGRLVRLDGQPYRVVGVLPGGLAYPDRQTRAWVPFRDHANERQLRLDVQRHRQAPS